MQPTSYRPTLLVFDSGMGGLSILQEIRSQLPGCHFLYAFDNAFFPYGERTEAELIQRAIAVTGAITARHAVDVVVVACNSASTVVLPSLRQRLGVPVVGVVPAIKPAAQLTRTGVVGLLATPGTVQRQYTRDLIAQYAAGIQVELLGSSELVHMAERKLYGEAVCLQRLSEILGPLLERAPMLDTLVLGCTHFPLLRPELRQVVGNTIRLLDSGEAIARRVCSMLPPPPAKADNTGGRNLVFCTQSILGPSELLLQAMKPLGLEQLVVLGDQAVCS